MVVTLYDRRTLAN